MNKRKKKGEGSGGSTKRRDEISGVPVSMYSGSEPTVTQATMRARGFKFSSFSLRPMKKSEW